MYSNFFQKKTECSYKFFYTRVFGPIFLKFQLFILLFGFVILQLVLHGVVCVGVLGDVGTDSKFSSKARVFSHYGYKMYKYKYISESVTKAGKRMCGVLSALQKIPLCTKTCTSSLNTPRISGRLLNMNGATAFIRNSAQYGQNNSRKTEEIHLKNFSSSILPISITRNLKYIFGNLSMNCSYEMHDEYLGGNKRAATNDHSTFVSHHYRIMSGDIIEYLKRKRIEYMEGPLKFTLKFCPFCPPHRFRSDNLYKHEIFKNSGNSYCHRCGYKGSLFDFKAYMGDLPGGLIENALDSSFSDGIFGGSKVVDDSPLTMINVAQYETNLYNNDKYKPVLDYLTNTRGISIETLKKYHVGAGEFTFYRTDSKDKADLCVVFPWLMAKKRRDNADIIVNRIKVRCIHDKSKMKLLPRGGNWGMFGEHLLVEELNKPDNETKSIVLTEGEFDAMAVNEATKRTAISLPNGSNSLPVVLLPRLEKLNHIYLWMDFDAAGQGGINNFANKLGIQRTKIVRDINDKLDSEYAEKLVSNAKDANECHLRGLKISSYLESASPLSHSKLLNFNDIRQSVFEELSNPKATYGVESMTLPGLSQLLKGHRLGELSVWTGSTGSGKTTLLSQLSIDYCVQGVSTLWGSFEINNVRLAKTMLRQFSGKNLENSLEDFGYYADKFSELPLRFMKFHGSTCIDNVIDAMDYAVYVHDVRHIIIDNLQFMLSGQSVKSGEIWELQNSAIEKFRRFATNKNVHISLVVHPRKEADGTSLGLSSVFGSVKSTQEADNVLILQNVAGDHRYIDVKKNRFAGRLGRIMFRFNSTSLTAEEVNMSEFLMEPAKNEDSALRRVNSKTYKAQPSKSQPKGGTNAPLLNGGSGYLFANNPTNVSVPPSNGTLSCMAKSASKSTSFYRSQIIPSDKRNFHSVKEEFKSQNNASKIGEVPSTAGKVVSKESTEGNITHAEVPSENLEKISMRGIEITKNSTIKEYREFIKANRLAELVKTAGKGVVKEKIYYKIRENVPPLSIIRTNSDVQGSTPNIPHDFRLSTVKPCLLLEDTYIELRDDFDDFERRILEKFSHKPASNGSPSGTDKNIESICLPVYKQSDKVGEELLSKGLIYVKDEQLLNRVEPLFKNVKVCAFDIESTGLDFRNDKIRLIQLSTPDHPPVIIDVNRVKIETLKGCTWLNELLQSKNVVKILHNGKFDINFLHHNGLYLETPIFDTMIAAKLLGASRFNWSCKLGNVAERYYDLELDKSQQFSDWTLEPLFEEQILYASRDTAVLLPLYVILKDNLLRNKLDKIAEIEFLCVPAVCAMERSGIKVDVDKLHKLQQELNIENKVASEKLGRALKVDGNANFNYNSQKQLLSALQGLGITDRTKRMLIQDTSEKTLLRNMVHPAISALREYRKVNKSVTAFTLKIPNHICKETGRIYPNFNQCGAESGRFSCDNPNLQQIPREKRFRECFVAEKGYKLVIADFSQIELRIAADIAKDNKMIDAYNNRMDLHSLTASLVKAKPISEVTKEERQMAKAVNFGLIFGMSLTGFRTYAETFYNVKLSLSEARKIYSSFFKNFSGIAAWHNRVKEERPTKVRTLSNRLSIFETFAFTRSLNYPVQGTSADITKEAMSRLVENVKRLDSRIVMCIHDEIILETPEQNAKEALEMLIETMQTAGNKFLRYVPCEAVGSIGDNWAEK